MEAAAVILVLVIVTPEGQRNIMREIPMESAEQCIEYAGDFLKHTPPPVLEAQGLVASCKVKLRPTT